MATACYPCPKGYFCQSSGLSEICPAGYFCPEGTGMDLSVCPRGMFSNQTGLYEVEQCSLCSPGYYCDGVHLSSPTGNFSGKCLVINGDLYLF